MDMRYRLTTSPLLSPTVNTAGTGARSSFQVETKGARWWEWNGGDEFVALRRGIGTYRFQLLRIVKLKGSTEKLALGVTGATDDQGWSKLAREGGERSEAEGKGAGLGVIGWKISPSRIAKQLGPQIPLRGSASKCIHCYSSQGTNSISLIGRV